METMTISLPPPLKAFIEAQVDEGGYRTPSEFIGELVREAQKRKAREKVEALLGEGLKSEPSEMTKEDWEELKRGVWEGHAKQSGQ